MSRDDMTTALETALQKLLAEPDRKAWAEAIAAGLRAQGLRLIRASEGHYPLPTGQTFQSGAHHATAEEAADCVTCSPSSLPRRIEDGGDRG